VKEEGSSHTLITFAPLTIPSYTRVLTEPTLTYLKEKR
jgi:hypothetical protein